MAERVASLAFAVRPRVLAGHLARVALALAGLSAVPLAVGLLFGDTGFALRMSVVLAVLLLLGLPGSRLPLPDLQVNEALSFVALAFLLAALAMTWPLMSAGVPVLDAFFESVSGVTTTGLSTVPEIAARPPSFLFLRAWMQWYGGLGFVVLSVALLMGHGAAGRRLLLEQAGDNPVSSGRIHARRMLRVYVVLTALGFLVSWLALGRPFEALLHTFSAVSTGGFSSLDESLAGLPDWPARLSVLAVAFTGAVPLFLYYQAANGGWRRSLGDPELHALVLLAAGLAALLMLLIPGANTGLHALALAVSAQTTTGFSTLQPGTLDDAAKLALVAGMAVGGGLGSTAGGIKVLRLLTVLRLLQSALQRTALAPHAVVVARLGRRSLHEDDLLRALTVLILFAFTLGISWLAFAACGYAPADALFEVTSATATVGLSTGIVRPDLEPGLKLLLCADMLLGRVEILAVLVLIYPRTWVGNRVSGT